MTTGAPNDPGLHVEGDRFTLVRDGIMERVAIPFRYRNGRAERVYHPTCRPNGGPPTVNLEIEKLVGGAWVHGWSQALPACLSEPIIIEPGATFRDTLRVVLHPQDTLHQPLLVPGAPLDGAYRLVWRDLLTTYHPERYPFGEALPLEDRASGAFALGR